MSILFSVAILVIGILLTTTIVYFHKYKGVLAELSTVKIERDIDELTGVYNRTGFNRIANKVYASHKRDSHTNISFAFLDLDDFKSINDGKGHGFGDEVLKIFAEILTRTVRETDVVGRQGGDEFVILFTNTDDTKAIDLEALLARMRKNFEARVNELYLADDDTRPTAVSVSFGIAQHQADRFHNLEELIDAADKALYQNKVARGRI